MTIDEAIKEQKIFISYTTNRLTAKRIEAIRIGIEALKFHKYMREKIGKGYTVLLPGETES